ncbi:hypothetical protein B0T18DRAFT_423536 [Schizothecium vesticola]|uniref:Uncharacterized protein n=1 Tax=Schizothecium vesticola TaxID=314040 RepID=A0AA40F860_9PEZI|nr:hypothetical protein B0T18DRAFT_423536 [Schizothecium vesticola]
MTSDAEANTLFWKAYATSILQLLTSGGATVGPNSRVYIASSNHNTNGGFTFNPTAASGGYVEALALYLETIKPAASNVNVQTMAQLQAAQVNVDAADTRVTDALTAASKKWEVDPNGKGTTPWLSWYPDNAPQYVDALENYDSVKGVLILLTDDVYGPGVGQLTEDLKVLKNALKTKLPLNPGVTMEASLDDITMDSAFALHFPSPLKTFTVPAYTITGYGAEIDSWMLTNMKSRVPAFSSTISSTVGRQYTAKSFGHVEASDSVGFDDGVFSGGAEGGSSTDSSSFQFGQWADEITLTLTVNFAQTMTISAGEWNVDVRDLVTKMGATPPASVTPRVRPTQALFASGVGLKVTFGATAGSQFDTFYKKNQAASGGFSIFGFHIGGSASSSVTKVTNDCTWDATSCTVTIQPAPTAHNAQLLAVMGVVVIL